MKNTTLLRFFYALTLGSILLHGCRKEETTPVPDPNKVTDGRDVEDGDIAGFFLLNEGNMGSNKATIDYFDYQSGEYLLDIYPQHNPEVVKYLGDVGNDIQIYGDRLFAVINCSNLVEVMELSTLKHVTEISIPNCRYIAFKGKYAYVTSYAGPVQIDPNARLGYVAKIDLDTYETVGTCVVGYQPEELVVVGEKLYVANSGGYKIGNYDYTVSVIDLDTFTETKKIEVAINLHRLKLDNHGKLWASSRGDYYDTGSKTFIIDPRTDTVTDILHLVPNSNMTVCGDSLYVYSTEWSYPLNKNVVTYAIVNTVTKQVVTRNFIKDGTQSEIRVPYGIAVNPETREILITDAKDYLTPGKLHCYSPDGIRRWSVTTGEIPAHIVFTRTKLK